MAVRRPSSLKDPETLRQFVQTVKEGIYITDAQGKIIDANPAFLEMFGFSSQEELRNYVAADLLVDPAQRQNQLEILNRTGEVRDYELRIKCLDGTSRTVLDTCYRIPAARSKKVLFHGILVDITQHKELEQRLRELGIRDPLTGCYNRRYLAQLEDQLNPSAESWGVILTDIDHFKQYNDTHGHHVGDALLMRLGRFLTRSVRTRDPVIRLGGDEFTIVLIGKRAHFTRKVVERLGLAAKATIPVTFSLGWSLRQGSESLQRSLIRADQRMITVRVRKRQRERRRRE